MGNSIEIGRYKDGFFSACRPIHTEGAPQQVNGYDQAVKYAQNHPGAELIVPRTGGGTYSYDVFTLTIGKKNDKQLAGAPAKALHFVSNVPAEADAAEVFVMDEAQQVRLFMPEGQDNDLAVGRHILDHARGRDIEGSVGLSASLGNAGMRTRITGLLGDLRVAKGKLEEAETTLKGELATAKQVLADKQLPYEVALNGAQAELSSTTSAQAAIVRTRSDELKEAQRPGIFAAEADVRTWQGNVSDAQSAVDNARYQMTAARDGMATVDAMESELRNQRNRLRQVEYKIQDGASYESQVRAYEAYQKAVAAGQHPPVVAKPNRPSSWGSWDDMNSLRRDRDNLQRRIQQTEYDLPRLRDEAVRKLTLAEVAVERAGSQLGYAEGKLDGAKDHLNSLPVGDPTKIRQAENALSDAKSKQATLVNAAQAKVTAASTALEVNTREERKAVETLTLALQHAPEAYQAIITAMAKEMGL